MDRLGTPVTQLLGAAAGIVLGAVVLFSVIGAVRGDDTATPEVADGTDVVAADDGAADDGAAASEDEDAGEPADEDDTAADEQAGDASTEPAGEPSPDEPADEEPAAEDEPEDEPSDEQTVPASVDPASISIQVLDATGTGSRSAANAVADELREAGYNVVVVNSAGRVYDVTTVFWSPGQAAGGQQLASQFSIARAEETPDEVRLSNSVDAHVVVGKDRA